MLEIVKKTGTDKDEESSNKILKRLDMKSISLKKHEWNLANMVPISTTAHKMTFGHLVILHFREQSFGKPEGHHKQTYYVLGFKKENGMLRWWNLDKCLKSSKAIKRKKPRDQETFFSFSSKGILNTPQHTATSVSNQKLRCCFCWKSCMVFLRCYCLLLA